MEEISELWEELKFELGSVGIETLPKDKQEITFDTTFMF